MFAKFDPIRKSCEHTFGKITRERDRNRCRLLSGITRSTKGSLCIFNTINDRVGGELEMESNKEDANDGIADPGKRVEVVTGQIRAYVRRRH